MVNDSGKLPNNGRYFEKFTHLEEYTVKNP